MLQLCFLGGLVQTGIVKGPNLPADTGATLPTCSDLNFCPSGRRRLEFSPVTILVGAQIVDRRIS